MSAYTAPAASAAAQSVLVAGLQSQVNTQILALLNRYSESDNKEATAKYYSAFITEQLINLMIQINRKAEDILSDVGADLFEALEQLKLGDELDALKLSGSVSVLDIIYKLSLVFFAGSSDTHVDVSSLKEDIETAEREIDGILTEVYRHQISESNFITTVVSELQTSQSSESWNAAIATGVKVASYKGDLAYISESYDGYVPPSDEGLDQYNAFFTHILVAIRAGISVLPASEESVDDVDAAETVEAVPVTTEIVPEEEEPVVSQDDDLEAAVFKEKVIDDKEVVAEVPAEKVDDEEVAAPVVATTDVEDLPEPSTAAPAVVEDDEVSQTVAPVTTQVEDTHPTIADADETPTAAEAEEVADVDADKSETKEEAVEAADEVKEDEDSPVNELDTTESEVVRQPEEAEVAELETETPAAAAPETSATPVADVEEDVKAVVEEAIPAEDVTVGESVSKPVLTEDVTTVVAQEEQDEDTKDVEPTVDAPTAPIEEPKDATSEETTTDAVVEEVAKVDDEPEVQNEEVQETPAATAEIEAADAPAPKVDQTEEVKHDEPVITTADVDETTSVPAESPRPTPAVPNCTPAVAPAQVVAVPNDDNEQAPAKGGCTPQ